MLQGGNTTIDKRNIYPIVGENAYRWDQDKAQSESNQKIATQLVAKLQCMRNFQSRSDRVDLREFEQQLPSLLCTLEEHARGSASKLIPRADVVKLIEEGDRWSNREKKMRREVSSLSDSM